MKVKRKSSEQYIPILDSSLEGNPSLNGWNTDGGSSSCYGFGGDDE